MKNGNDKDESNMHRALTSLLPSIIHSQQPQQATTDDADDDDRIDGRIER